MRLFIASSLPKSISDTAQRYQPPAHEGVRIVRPDLLHMTLQFIGEAKPLEVDQALQSVRFKPFKTQFSQTGLFSPKKSKTILWLGLAPNEKLLALHQQITKALITHEIHIDARKYTPHITLARCKRSIEPSYTRDFLDQKISPTSYTIDQFHLYHSHNQNGQLQYDILTSYNSR